MSDLNKTEYFHAVKDNQIDPSNPTPYHRPFGFGVNDDDEFLAQNGHWRLWTNTVSPPPHIYHRLIMGVPTPNVALKRVERVDLYSPMTSEEIVDRKKREMSDQIPEVTPGDYFIDPSAMAARDQIMLRYKAGIEALSQTADEDLIEFNSDLTVHQIREPDYAKNLCDQEVHNMTVHNGLVSAGNGGLYDADEAAAIRQRIQHNAKVARGELTGIQVPSLGAQRSDITLDGEVIAESSFWQEPLQWNNQDYFIVRAMLNEIPDSVSTAHVFAMIYDGDNNYLTWLPFEQQSNGRWLTPKHNPDGSPRIPPGRTLDSNWRVAIAYLGTHPQYEITRRVFVAGSSSAWSIVRWFGRIL